MVGAPSPETKGCHTCKRRKVKCDKRRPECQRCFRSGHQCEGYARGLVFLNRTAKGVQKRQIHDEVALNKPVVPHKIIAADQIQLPRSMNVIQLVSLYTRSYLVDCWLPTTSYDVPAAEWLLRAHDLGGPEDLLQSSINALSLALVGNHRGDASMVRHSQQIYGEALVSLQRALWDPDLVNEEQTLAACQTLKIYEASYANIRQASANLLQISQVASGSDRDLDAHVRGAMSLLLHQGSHRRQSPLRKAVAREIRYSAMANGLQHRRRSALDELGWRTTELNSHGDVESSLIDHGLDVVALSDQLKDLEGGSPDPILATTCFIRAMALVEELDAWYQSAVTLHFLSSEWPHVIAEVPAQAPSLSARKAQVDLETLRQSFLIVDYWALRILLSVMISTMVSKMPMEAPLPPNIRELGETYERDLIENILAVVPYQSREEHGFTASSRCTLPLMVSLHTLKRHKGEHTGALTGRVGSLFGHLKTNRGINYHHRLTKVGENWRPPRS